MKWALAENQIRSSLQHKSWMLQRNNATSAVLQTQKWIQPKREERHLFLFGAVVLNVVLVRKFELVPSKPGSTLPKKLVVEVRSLKCGSQQHRNVMKGRGCASDAHVLAGYSEVVLSVLSLDSTGPLDHIGRALHNMSAGRSGLAPTVLSLQDKIDRIIFRSVNTRKAAYKLERQVWSQSIAGWNTEIKSKERHE